MNRLRLRVATLPGLIALGLIALATGCALVDSAPPPSFETPDRGPTDVGNIVYTGEDGNIYTVDAASGESTAITSQSHRRGGRPYDFVQPMWSPDGTRISYTGTFFPEGERRRHFIYINNVETGEVRVHETGVDQPPAYVQWAPDGRRISYARTSATGATVELVIWNIETDESQVVLTGRPIFWDWAPDGSYLAANTGASAFTGAGGTLHVITARDDRYEARELPASTAFFQTPVVSPAGDVFAASLQGSGVTNRVAFFARDGNEYEEIAAISLAGAFAWSPEGERLAYLDGTTRQTGGLIGTLRLIDRHGIPPTAGARPVPAGGRGAGGRVAFDTHMPGDRRRSASGAGSRMPDGPGPTRSSGLAVAATTRQPPLHTPSSSEPALSGVSSFVWSPDGELIAYFQPSVRPADQEAGTAQRWQNVLGIIESDTGRARRLGPVVPGAEFYGTYIPYFDQYNRSGTIWSPDSRSLLLNAQTEDENRPGIYLVDVETMERELIAHGHMPFWRPAVD